MIARNVILAFRPVQKAFDAYERELEAFAAASRATDERRQAIMSNARMYFHGVMDKAVVLYERADEEREQEKYAEQRQQEWAAKNPQIPEQPGAEFYSESPNLEKIRDLEKKLASLYTEHYDDLEKSDAETYKKALDLREQTKTKEAVNGKA